MSLFFTSAGNRLHSCAIHSLSYVQSTHFICCTVSSKYFTSLGETCAQKLGINYTTLNLCSEGDEGNQLHYLNGIKTSNLSPEHDGVPWILLNGKHDEAEMSMARLDLTGLLGSYLYPETTVSNAWDYCWFIIYGLVTIVVIVILYLRSRVAGLIQSLADEHGMFRLSSMEKV